MLVLKLIPVALSLWVVFGHYRLGSERSGQASAIIAGLFVAFGLYGGLGSGTWVLWFVTYVIAVGMYIVRRFVNGRPQR